MIDTLKFIADHSGMNLADALKEAYEQGKRDAQPEACEDAVSRADVVDMLEMYPFTEYSEYEAAREVVKRLLSVTPKAEQQWIPCSKTVDIPDHEILACDKYGKEMFGYLVYEDEQWLCASDGCVMYDPIAWREKPEPYREEGDE